MKQSLSFSDDPFENETKFLRPWNRPQKFAHDDGIIRGLKEYMLETSYAQFRDSISRDVLSEIGVSKSNIPENLFKKIHFAIRRDSKFTNFNDIREYLKISGFGIQTAQLVHFASTGDECPLDILESYKLREELFGQGKNLVNPMSSKDYSRYTSGNTVIPIESVNDVYKRGDYNCPLKEIIQEGSDDIHMIRDDDNKVVALMDIDNYKAEEYINRTLDNESIVLNTLGFQRRSEFPYTDEQLGVIDEILKSKSKFNVLTGAGGVGKSVTVSAIIGGVDPTHNIMVVCPTGMASKRLKESDISEKRLVTPISTIHSAYFKRNIGRESTRPLKTYNTVEIRENEHDPNFIVIDEASMMDSKTMGLLISQYPSAKWLLIGDPEQLPPVGCGSVFNTLIENELCPINRLTKVLRTSDETMLQFFNDVRNEVDWGLHDYPDFFESCPSERALQRKLDELIGEFVEIDGWEHDSAIISHRNTVVEYINYAFYKKLNGPIDRLEDQTMGDFNAFPPIPWWYVGAKVVFTENDGELQTVNGDIGYVISITNISKSPKFKKYLTKIQVGDAVVEVDSTYGSIKLAYALTIHKTQGSEYKNVYYVHFNRSEIRSLFYTAVTRAREKFVILTPKHECYYHQNPPPRNTYITHR